MAGTAHPITTTAATHFPFPFLSHPPPTIPTTTHRFRLRPLLAGPTATPKRTSIRKNHLRPKILKTLIKPFLTAPVPLIEPIPLHTTPPPPLPDDAVCDPNEIPTSSEGEVLLAPDEKVEQFLASETVNPAVEYGSNVGKLSVKSVLKFGGYLLGVFLFQTICAVLVLGVSNSVKEEESSYKGSALTNGEVVYVDKEEMERRIREIREMAREARERERREKGREEGEGSEIEKEIGVRLSKVEKGLEKKKIEMLRGGSVLDYLGLFEEEEEDEDGDGPEDGGGIQRLMFEKKRKFRSSLLASSSKPEGFLGSDQGSRRVNGSDSHVVVNHTGKKLVDSGERNGKKLEKEDAHAQREMDAACHNPGSWVLIKTLGALQETFKGTSEVEVTKSWEPQDSKRQDKQSVREESQRISTKYTSVNGNISIDSGKRPLSVEAGDKQLDAQSDLWWLNLPYVLAILMRRGSEQDRSGGLFALRLTSSVDVQEDIAYTLAFEDRSDANNFCLLLESYFDELGDFSADIVPMSTKELHKSVKSQTRKALVVKKGQLKLYAGQPFVEVERALCSMLE